MVTDPGGFDWLNAAVQVVAIFAAFAAGLWASNRAHDRERAIGDRRLAQALLAELARFTQQLDDQPEVAAGSPGNHSWTGSLVVEMIKTDPGTLPLLMRLEPQLATRATAWTSLRTQRREIAHREEHVRIGEAVAGGTKGLVSDEAMAIQQAQLSRDHLVTLREQLTAYEEAFDATDRVIRGTIAQLEAQLRRTADAPVPPASPFHDTASF